MRSTISALVIAAGLIGFGAAAQAAPVSTASPAGLSNSPVVHVQMMRRDRRVMRHRMMRHRVMRRRMHRM